MINIFRGFFKVHETYFQHCFFSSSLSLFINNVVQTVYLQFLLRTIHIPFKVLKKHMKVDYLVQYRKAA